MWTHKEKEKEKKKKWVKKKKIFYQKTGKKKK